MTYEVIWYEKLCSQTKGHDELAQSNSPSWKSELQTIRQLVVEKIRHREWVHSQLRISPVLWGGREKMSRLSSPDRSTSSRVPEV